MKLWWWFGPPLLWAALIFWLSDQPLPPSPPGGDKLAHVVVYAILAALSLRALYFGTGWSIRAVVLAAGIASSLYGVSDELHQSYVPGRVASIEDLVADVVGTILGVAALALSYRWRGVARS